MKDNPYTDHLKLARSQRRKLERLAKKLLEMSCDWDGLDGGMEGDLMDLSDGTLHLIATLRECSESWRKGHGA